MDFGYASLPSEVQELIAKERTTLNLDDGKRKAVDLTRSRVLFKMLLRNMTANSTLYFSMRDAFLSDNAFAFDALFLHVDDDRSLPLKRQAYIIARTGRTRQNRLPHSTVVKDIEPFGPMTTIRHRRTRKPQNVHMELIVMEVMPLEMMKKIKHAKIRLPLFAKTGEAPDEYKTLYQYTTHRIYGVERPSLMMLHELEALGFNQLKSLEIEFVEYSINDGLRCSEELREELAREIKELVTLTESIDVKFMDGSKRIDWDLGCRFHCSV